MVYLNKEKMFFFSEDLSNLEIKPNSIEHAYLAILSDDLTSAKAVFQANDSPRSRWGIALISILEGYIKDFPTFFQIRNFIEIDTDFLLKNNKIDYVEQILGSLELLSTINQEVYKFIARVMYENRLYSASLKYMEKSKEIYYNDAELHFMLAKYYLGCKKSYDAYLYINQCLKLIPDYYPALCMKKEIEENMI